MSRFLPQFLLSDLCMSFNAASPENLDSTPAVLSNIKRTYSDGLHLHLKCPNEDTDIPGTIINFHFHFGQKWRKFPFYLAQNSTAIKSWTPLSKIVSGMIEGVVSFSPSLCFRSPSCVTPVLALLILLFMWLVLSCTEQVCSVLFLKWNRGLFRFTSGYISCGFSGRKAPVCDSEAVVAAATGISLLCLGLSIWGGTLISLAGLRSWSERLLSPAGPRQSQSVGQDCLVLEILFLYFLPFFFGNFWSS